MSSANADAVSGRDKGMWRDLVSYWVLGLCNNYGYVVMLCAAHDIIGRFTGEHFTRASGELSGTGRECHKMSTGAILLADILPSLCAKMLMPFVPFYVNIRIFICVALTVFSFLLVAFATQLWMAFLGVILTSASSGMGESTIMAYSSNFNKNVVSTWSSGTGGAGILGSVAYAALIGLGFSPRDTLLIMIIVPIIQAGFFWIVLRKPKDIPASSLTVFKEEEMADDVLCTTFKEKLLYASQFLNYVIPLLLVYFFEYVINQGLFELVNFKNTFLDHPAQYRWLNVDYQVGVFFSRSSVNVVQIRRIWILAVLQFVNDIYVMTEVIFYYTPSIWITFAVVFWEGLLGGAGYVNTFYRMSKEITPNKRSFAMMIVIMGDSTGILLAALTAIPVHNAICSLPLYH